MKYQKYGLIFFFSFVLILLTSIVPLWENVDAEHGYGGMPFVAYAQEGFVPPDDFVGTDELEAVRLIGSPAWGTSTVESIFRSGNWTFLDDGTFLFAPSVYANVRTDIFPIVGTYSISGNQLSIQGENPTDLSTASASIDGTLLVNGSEAELNIVYASTAMESQSVVEVSQVLIRSSQVPSTTVDEIESIAVPSAFTVSLTGTVDNQAFGPLPGSLKILESPYEDDSNPFLVSLLTDELNILGGFYWTSKAEPIAGNSDSDEFYSQMSVEDGRVQAVLNLNDATVRSDISWFTEDSGTLGQVVQMPVGVSQASQGEISFVVEGDRIQGDITIIGTSWFGQESNYQASFSGQRSDGQSKNVVSRQIRTTKDHNFLSFDHKSVELTQNIDPEDSTFTGTWSSESFGEVILNQEDQQVSGTYSGRGGGQVVGIVQNNRFDFTWQDSQGSGWGFFRSISNGRTLVGQWGNLNDSNPVSSVTATRISDAPRLVASDVDETDLVEYQFYGQTLVQQGRCEEAITILERSFALYAAENNNPNTTDLIRDSNLVSQLGALRGLTYCHRQLNDDDAFVDSLVEVLKIRQTLVQQSYLRTGAQAGLAQLTDWLDGWRVTLSNDLDRIEVLDKSRDFFDRLIWIFMELDETNEALVASEKGRARAIADVISVGLSDYTDDRSRIAKAPNLVEIFKTAEEQQVTLVEYAILSLESEDVDTLCIWVVTPSGEIHFKPFPLNEINLKKIIKNSRIALGERLRGGLVLPNVQPVDQAEQLRKLYQILIEPIQGWLPENELAHIVFIPQDELFLVPFPALLDTDNQPLISQHTVSTAPSIQVLSLTYNRHEQLRNDAHVNGTEILLVGNPEMPEVPDSEAIALDSLSGAEDEVENIAELYGSSTFTGQQATETLVKQYMPSARVIHFATHGFLENYGDDNLSQVPGSIALTSDEVNDGFLNSNEILQMDLNAELVVLSACDTGLGNITGDGVIGLSRSFFQAGTPSVLVSLWAVPDNATADLMTEFYRQWQAGKGKSQALRRAMLEISAEHENPRDWAAFTLIGAIN